MGVFTGFRRRVARAFESGDPRPGIGLGFIVSVAVAALFAAGTSAWVEMLEMRSLDALFLLRPAIRESPDIVVIDIDDNSIRDLGDYPFPRTDHAKVTLALRHLGAKQVVFDIQFKTQRPRIGTFDEKTGDLKLDEDDRNLQTAIGIGHNVLLAYNIEIEDPLSPALRHDFDRIRAVFAKSIATDGATVAKETGLSEAAIGAQIEALRREAAFALVREVLAQDPNVTFEQIKERLLPSYEGGRHGSELSLLQFCYALEKGTRLIEAKGVPIRVERSAERPLRGRHILPPYWGFMKNAVDSGFANAASDEVDGIIRRPWLYGFEGGRARLYLAFESAVRALEGTGRTAEVVVEPREVRVELKNRATGAHEHTIRIPTDGRGRVIINWAGNRQRRRLTGNLTFGHIPFNKLSQFHQDRFEYLDGNFRRFIEGLQESGAEVPDEYRKYLELTADQFAPDRLDSEPRLEEIRKAILRDMKTDIETIRSERDRLAKEGGQERLVKRLSERLGVLEVRLTELMAPYEEERLLRPLVDGKICVIGSASTASGDLHPTPLGGSTPGVDVQANVINMVLTEQFLRRVPAWANFLYLILVGLAITLAVTYWSTTRSAVVAGVLVGVSAVLFYQLFARGSLVITGAGPLITVALNFGAVMTFKQVVTQRSKRKLQKELARQTSEDLVAIILENPDVIAKPRKMAGTIFFSDVKGFTSISEGMEAERLVGFINRYLDRMTPIIKSNRGFVDKYIGDGIMALFGIPVATPSHAEDACRAALGCIGALREINEKFADERLPQVWMRVGVHTGDVISGYIGASDRSEYTVMGDNVNLASRLEGANKEYESNIIVSQATHDLVKDRFQFRELDNIRVVGRSKPVRIFELLAAKGEPLPVDPGFLAKYEAGLKAFWSREWQGAIDRFEEALALKPGDKPCLLHISRATDFVMSPPPDDWAGDFELLTK